MKTLYIAPVRDFSGYANAARGYIRALCKAGFGDQLVVRPVRYDNADMGTEYKPTELELELMQRPLDDIGIVIQHTTPNEMRPVQGKFNVAIAAWETTRIPEYWARKLNQFDVVITFCDTSVEAFRDSGVASPIFKIPHTFDMSSYNLDGVEPLSSFAEPEILKDRFVFYNISQLSAKKGIDSLLRAYYAQYHGELSSKVMLILKTYINMSNREEEGQQIAGYINNVKQAMRLKQDEYPPVAVITQTLADEQIKKLHRTGDCYVCSSRAEGWCIPAFEGLAYGNKLVTSDWGGMSEFIKTDGKRHPGVFVFGGSLEPLVGQAHSDPDLYTSKELVFEPSVTSMMSAMESARLSNLTERADLSEFDYDTVGVVMANILKQAGVTQ